MGKFKEKLSLKKVSTAQSDLMAEILTRVAQMVALGMDGTTIRVYVIQKVGESQWARLDKVLFMGMIEEALKRQGIKI